MESGNGDRESARGYTFGLANNKLAWDARKTRTADWENGLAAMCFGWMIAGIGGALSGQRLCKDAAPCPSLRPILRPGSELEEIGAEIGMGNGDRQHEEEERRVITASRVTEKFRDWLLNDPQELIRVFDLVKIVNAASATADVNNLEVGKDSVDASVGQPDATRMGGEIEAKPILDFSKLNGDWDWKCTWDTNQTGDSKGTENFHGHGDTEEVKGGGKTKGRHGAGSGLEYRYGSRDGYKGAAIAMGGANPAEREREKERGKSSTVSMEGSGIGAGECGHQKMPRGGVSLAKERALSLQDQVDTEETNQSETVKGLAKYWREAEQAKLNLNGAGASQCKGDTEEMNGVGAAGDWDHQEKFRIVTSKETEWTLTGVGERQTQGTTAVTYKKNIATAMITWMLMRWETQQESNRKAEQLETVTGLAARWRGTEKKKVKNWKPMLKYWIKHGGEGSRMTAD